MPFLRCDSGATKVPSLSACEENYKLLSRPVCLRLESPVAIAWQAGA